MRTLRETGMPRPEARFANFFQVGHRIFEFYLEFGQVHDEGEDAEPLIHSRIVTSPARAKALLDVLQQSVERYEREFGPIGEE